jgi:hypothetical protein
MTTNLSAVGSLILTRMLTVGEKGESAANIKKDLEPMLAHRWAGAALAEQINQTLIDLAALGMVIRLPVKSKKAVPKFLSTTEGRRHALEFLGVAQLKPKTTWSVVKTIYLPARALGMPASSETLFKTLKSEPNFQAVLLKRQYRLPVAEVPKPKEDIDALIWKLMGFEGESRKLNVKNIQTVLLNALVGKLMGIEGESRKFNLENIKTALLNRESGDERATKSKKAATKLLAKRLGAKSDNPKELRDAVVRGWIDQSENPSLSPSPPAPPPIELDLSAFAERVKSAARACSTGRFGDNKVFIAHVWRAVQSDPGFATMDLPAFKERLAEANNARLLDLSRADLVQAMDPEDVRESEVQYLNATFHFVRI